MKKPQKNAQRRTAVVSQEWKWSPIQHLKRRYRNKVQLLNSSKKHEFYRETNKMNYWLFGVVEVIKTSLNYPYHKIIHQLQSMYITKWYPEKKSTTKS